MIFFFRFLLFSYDENKFSNLTEEEEKKITKLVEEKYNYYADYDEKKCIINKKSKEYYEYMEFEPFTNEIWNGFVIEDNIRIRAIGEWGNNKGIKQCYKDEEIITYKNNLLYGYMSKDLEFRKEEDSLYVTYFKLTPVVKRLSIIYRISKNNELKNYEKVFFSMRDMFLIDKYIKKICDEKNCMLY